MNYGRRSTDRLRTSAKLTTASWLDEDIIQAITDKFEQKFDMVIDVEVEVDASILGGMIFTLGDHVFDGSARGRLESMREQLLNS